MYKYPPQVLILVLIATYRVLLPPLAFAEDSASWRRHLIDGSSRGADGVRTMDVNGDQRPDIVTGWEEGGITRIYIHPGYGDVQLVWPAVTVGATPNVEDAVFCDLDDDGSVDVVSSCEGKTRRLFVHWAPRRSESYLNAEAWTTQALPATVGTQAWMFTLPMDIDTRNGVDLAVASKGPDGCVGWLQAPINPRDLNRWQFRRLADARWIMSLFSYDIDQDGDLDLIMSDRKGAASGVFWLEHPGPAQSPTTVWHRHLVGARGREVMFLDVVDLNGDNRPDVVASVKPDELHWMEQPDNPKKTWTAHVLKVDLPAGIGSAKGIRAGDIDGDGRIDLVYTCEHAQPPKRGVVWLGRVSIGDRLSWVAHDISGPDGIKFDRVELLDIDGDKDLDVVTCEERHHDGGIGVFWYENPQCLTDEADAKK